MNSCLLCILAFLPYCCHMLFPDDICHQMLPSISYSGVYFKKWGFFSLPKPYAEEHLQWQLNKRESTTLQQHIPMYLEDVSVPRNKGTALNTWFKDFCSQWKAFQCFSRLWTRAPILGNILSKGRRMERSGCITCIASWPCGKCAWGRFLSRLYLNKYASSQRKLSLPIKWVNNRTPAWKEVSSFRHMILF